MKRVAGVSQLLINRGNRAEIVFIVAKITYHPLFAGDITNMAQFVERIKKRFEVSKAIIYDTILCNGCRIQQEKSDGISMGMGACVNTIEKMYIKRERRRDTNDKATETEYNKYRSLAGSVIWAGNGSLAHAVFVGSYMQQAATRLLIHDLTDSNRKLKEMRDLKPTIEFPRLEVAIHTVDLWTFSDAS